MAPSLSMRYRGSRLPMYTSAALKGHQGHQISGTSHAWKLGSCSSLCGCVDERLSLEDLSLQHLLQGQLTAQKHVRCTGPHVTGHSHFQKQFCSTKRKEGGVRRRPGLAAWASWWQSDVIYTGLPCWRAASGRKMLSVCTFGSSGSANSTIGQC